jgi:ketosteroid isomerase-like protein
MTKKLLLCASIALFALGVAVARSAPAAGPAEAVTARSRAFTHTAVQGDLATFATFMSDDYVMLWVEPATDAKKAHWATKTKKEWMEELRSGKNHYRSVELNNMKVHFHGNVAILTGDYTQTGTRAGVAYSEAGLFNETWVKRNDEWVIVGSVFP